MNSLDKQVVVITGSSRGFGLAMAREFQNAGARVALSSRNSEAVQKAIATLPNPANAIGMACDVRELAQVCALADATITRFGKIDVWINNAGISPGWGKTADIDAAQWRESFETNFIGAVNGCRVALEKMLPHRCGQIVNVLGAGADRPAPNQSAYGTSKAALKMFTQTLAQEYADSGIAIFALMPGMMWTDLLLEAKGVDEPQQRARFEWAMRVFGNPPHVPAQFIRDIIERGGTSGHVYRVLSPKMFVPRMIGEMLGAGKKNPHPWDTP
jgi:NAD(P)-dependent dehydrogenase (short-subunit alcohol dehydrogenase family)